MSHDGDRRIALGLLGLQAVCYLVLSRPVYAGAPLETVAAILAVLLVPGFAAVRLAPTAIRPHALPLALPAGVLLVAVTSGVAALAHWPIRPLGAMHLFAGFLLTLVVLLRGRGGDLRVPGRPILLLLVAIGLVAGYAGAPVSPYTDGPDHVATVREIVHTGDPFPPQALLADGEVERSDPRKGVFHVGLALVSSLAGVEPHVVWRWAPLVLAPAWALALWLFGLRLGFSPGATGLAVLLAALFAGGTGLPFATRVGYGGHLASVCVWAVWALQLGHPRGGHAERLGAGLLLATATAVHPLAPGLWAIPLAGLWAMAPRGERSRVARDAIMVGLCAAPVLAWRWLEASGPVNPLHHQPMPVLEVASGWSVLWPPAVIRQLGLAGVLGGLLCLTALRWEGATPRARFLTATAGMAFLVNLIPGVFDAVRAVGSSLSIKMLYMVPASFALAGYLLSGGSRYRDAGRVLVVLVLVVAAPAAAERFSPDRARVGRTAAMDSVLTSLRTIHGRGVVAADPWLSYLITAETPHYAVAVPPQHGHPLDARGPERLSDLAAVLAPNEPVGRAIDRLETYRAWFVAVADGSPPEIGFAAARGGALDDHRRLRWRRAPEFRPEPGAPGVWRRDRSGPGASPSPGLPQAAVGGIPVDAADGRVGEIVLERVAFAQRSPAGSGIPLVLTWKRSGDAVTWPVEVHIRLRGPGRRGCGKPWRILRERFLGAPRSGTRARLSPFQAAWPPVSWPMAEAVSETVHVGHELPPGSYELAVRVLEKPVHPRVGLADLWWEDDRWQGQPLGIVTVDLPANGSPTR